MRHNPFADLGKLAAGEFTNRELYLALGQLVAMDKAAGEITVPGPQDILGSFTAADKGRDFRGSYGSHSKQEPLGQTTITSTPITQDVIFGDQTTPETREQLHGGLSSPTTDALAKMEALRADPHGGMSNPVDAVLLKQLALQSLAQRAVAARGSLKGPGFAAPPEGAEPLRSKGVLPEATSTHGWVLPGKSRTIDYPTGESPPLPETEFLRAPMESTTIGHKAPKPSIKNEDPALVKERNKTPNVEPEVKREDKPLPVIPAGGTAPLFTSLGQHAAAQPHKSEPVREKAKEDTSLSAGPMRMGIRNEDPSLIKKPETAKPKAEKPKSEEQPTDKPTKEGPPKPKFDEIERNKLEDVTPRYWDRQPMGEGTDEGDLEPVRAALQAMLQTRLLKNRASAADLLPKTRK